MKILVVGQCPAYSAVEYLTHDCMEAWELGTARALARRGNEVHLAAGEGPHAGDDLVRFIRWTDVDVASYDGIVLVAVSGHRSFCARPAQFEALARHGNVFGWFDYLDTTTLGLSYTKTVGITDLQAYGLFHDAYPDTPTILLPFAVPEIRGAHDVPWTNRGVPKIVYCGAMYDRRQLEIINRIAADTSLEVWLGGYWLSDTGWDGFTDTERRELLHPRVRFFTDVLQYTQPLRSTDRPHGMTRYQDTFRFLLHADVGLCFTRTPARNVFASKIYHYLGCGLPTVVEDWVANRGDVLNIEAGVVTPWNDPEAFHAAVRQTIDVAHDHRRIAREAHAWANWDDRARVIEAALSEQQKPKPTDVSAVPRQARGVAVSVAEMIDAIPDISSKAYLEIGVRGGGVFSYVHPKTKIGVDTDPKTPATFHMTSSEYFGGPGRGQTFDVVYINGNHAYAAVLDDFNLAAAALRTGGIILVDNLVPATATRASHYLCGDGYKLLLYLLQERTMRLAVQDGDDGLTAVFDAVPVSPGPEYTSATYTEFMTALSKIRTYYPLEMKAILLGELQ